MSSADTSANVSNASAMVILLIGGIVATTRPGSVTAPFVARATSCSVSRMTSSTVPGARYHSSIVNSGLWWSPTSSERKALEICMSRGWPSASMRFIWYSGDVLR